ncbi:dTDP-4-dehydrorhamnose reductase [Streptomyces sp. CA-132043]|uniref:dTDP-4-dehydrorhamnose reductase n=1 Tax=Streptomyces sp. CA-132043 TaxID=3240048 RepID=UPI003D8ECC22
MATVNRWLVTGAAGMLGQEVCEALTEAGHAVLPLARTDLDLTHPGAVTRTLHRARPSVVVNCAAWTDVDAAEHAEADALRINGAGVRTLARACATVGARLLHVSTDYVFAGDTDVSRAEDAAPDPRTAYGRTKLAGERAVLEELPHLGTVVRTGWLYGRHGPNFVTTVLRKAAAGERVRVVDDQHGQPTWARDVAEALIGLGTLPDRLARGVFHATSAGRTTWHGLARHVYRAAGADPGLVDACSTAELGRPAPRPAHSHLSHHRWALTGLPAPRAWEDALEAALPALGVPPVPAARHH